MRSIVKVSRKDLIMVNNKIIKMMSIVVQDDFKIYRSVDVIVIFYIIKM